MKQLRLSTKHQKNKKEIHNFNVIKSITTKPKYHTQQYQTRPETRQKKRWCIR